MYHTKSCCMNNQIKNVTILDSKNTKKHYYGEHKF